MRATRTLVDVTGDAFTALADYPRVVVAKGRGRGGSIVIAGTYGEGLAVSKIVGRRKASFTVPAPFALKAGNYSLHETIQSVNGSDGPVYVMRNPRPLVNDVVNVRAYAKGS